MYERYAQYATLRETSPCHWQSDRRQCLLTRFADVYAVLRNHEEFSSARQLTIGRSSPARTGSASILICDDPPRHAEIRSLVNRWFATKSLEAFRPWITTAVLCLVDGWSSGRIEFVSQFAEPLPVMTIAHLLGLEPTQWPKFKLWSSAVFGQLVRPGSEEQFRQVLSAYKFFANEVEIRRRSPTGDLISHILQQSNGAYRLTDIEAQAYCILFLVAGNETTINLLSNLINALSVEPALWTQLRAGNVASDAIVDEALRFDSPVQIIRRLVKRRTEVNNLRFEAGDIIEACLGAANRDPLQFENPDMFEPERESRRHLAFGQGIHYCLGAPLARLIANIAVTELAKRFKVVNRSCDSVRSLSYTMSGFVSLPLTFER
jgi:cytochrome P450